MPTTYEQKSFAGGIDLFTERTRLAEDKLPLLINARSRFGKLRAIRKPLRVTAGLPANANYQGLYTAGNYAIVFANGSAYVRNLDVAGSIFNQVPGFQMSATVDTIYLELVPASTINYGRKLTTALEPESGVELFTLSGTTIAPSPIAAVIQDGINQPWVILSTGEARVTLNYDQWQNTDTGREYVPIGKQMVYADGKLWIATPDGKAIYQSVSGRPLDFMVVIDSAGNKLATEQLGGAANVSHRTSYNTITCLGKIPTAEGGFYVGVQGSSFVVVPDKSAPTIYGEYRLINRYITSTGAINQFSFLGDVSGDSCFIDLAGIKSFNAVLQFRNAGKNSPFSLPLQPLFNEQIQSITAAGQFDNYDAFAVQTTYGNAVIWYDELAECWCAVDLWDDSELDGAIRMFAEAQLSSGVRTLFILTQNGGVYQYDASDSVATAKAYIGDWTTGDPEVEQSVEDVRMIFSRTETSGLLTLALYVDNTLVRTVSQTVAGNFVGVNSANLPFGDSGVDAITNTAFSMLRAPSGFQFGCYVTWNFLADFTHISASVAAQKSTTNVQQQIAAYANASRVLR